MPSVTYTDPSGASHSLVGDDGMTVMDLALKNGVPGIIAECGGFMNCASCHVYVEPTWAGAVGPASGEEAELLEGAMSERLPCSRLSCQLPLSEALDGLRVTIPPTQT